MSRLLLVLGALLVVLAGCGGEDTAPVVSPPEADGPQHIHGLGINPSDQALIIATHTGLFRAAPSQRQASRITDRHQDTMGFTVVGPDRFLGSGHPDLREDLPPLLGLIRSDDAGRSWQPVSLLGQADFHVLRAAGARIYGFDSTQSRLMASSDGGRTWKENRPPDPLLDLAIDPQDPDRIVASTEAGLFISRDAGATWRALHSDRAGLLAWRDDGLVLVDLAGDVSRSTDGGRRFEPVGEIGGQPAAFATHGEDLYVALHTNAVLVSGDRGRSWQERVTAAAPG
jgi:hypothetical protein